jgi:hypothetical protein
MSIKNDWFLQWVSERQKFSFVLAYVHFNQDQLEENLRFGDTYRCFACLVQWSLQHRQDLFVKFLVVSHLFLSSTAFFLVDFCDALAFSNN